MIEWPEKIHTRSSTSSKSRTSNNFEKKSEPKVGPVKVEHIIGHLEYNETKVFINLHDLDYEYSTFKLQGNLFKVNLYDIKSSDDIQDLLIKPALKLFRAKVHKITTQ